MSCYFKKKGVGIVNIFQKSLDSSNRKLNKILVYQGSEFYNSLFKKWLKDNDIETYSTFNEGKSIVAKRFIGALKNKNFKHMAAVKKCLFWCFTWYCWWIQYDISTNY